MPVPVIARLLSVVVPPACVACRAALPRDDGVVLCPRCVRALPWLPRGVCSRCALPSHGGRRCPARRAAFERSRAVVAHEGVGRELVHAMKFRGAHAVAELMAAQIAARHRFPDGAVLAAVPGTRARRRRRGFDPAEWIAAALAERVGAHMVRALQRRDGARQLGAGVRDRRRAGRLCFHAIAAPPRVVLVDDVHTTGATLDAAAAALRAAGVDYVEAVTYTRTL